MNWVSLQPQPLTDNPVFDPIAQLWVLNLEDCFYRAVLEGVGEYASMRLFDIFDSHHVLDRGLWFILDSRQIDEAVGQSNGSPTKPVFFFTLDLY